MTMTPERLAKLDAVMAKLSEPRPTKIEHKYTISDWCGRIEYAKYALADAYPDLRAHIDAQAATIARLREAAKRIADHPNFYITACECGEPECATTQFIAAIAEAEGAQ